MPSLARQSRMQRIASSMCFEMRWHLVRVMVRVRARVRIRVRVSG